MVEFEIRDSRAEDAPALAALYNALYPDRPMTAEGVLARDRQRAPDALVGRWVAEIGGQVVGMGMFHQPTHDYAPGRFRVWVHMAADYRRRGIGLALYARVLEGLAAFRPHALRANVRDNQADGLRFLARQGYRRDPARPGFVPGRGRFRLRTLRRIRSPLRRRDNRDPIAGGTGGRRGPRSQAVRSGMDPVPGYARRGPRLPPPVRPVGARGDRQSAAASGRLLHRPGRRRVRWPTATSGGNQAGRSWRSA